MNKVLVAVMLIVGLAFVGCSGDDDGGKNGPASGTTAISLELSGGHLSEPLVFSGTIERSPNLFATSTSILAMGVDLQATNGDAVLQQFTVSLETGESGPYDAEGGDLDLVFWFPGISQTYSLRPHGGSGGVDLDRGNEDRATLEIDFDASPTQLGGKDEVFRLKGVIDARK